MSIEPKKPEELIEKARLTDEEILKAFDGDFGELYFDHKPTAEDIMLIKLKLVSQKSQENVWNLVVKEAGVCPKCGVRRQKSLRLGTYWCESCHSTGRIKPKTILDLIKEV